MTDLPQGFTAEPPEATPQAAASETAEVVFLGVCQRSACVPDAATGWPTWNALAIRHFVASFIYPMPLVGVHFAFAVRLNGEGGFHVEVVSPTGSTIGWLNAEAMTPPRDGTGDQSDGTLMPILNSSGWMPLFVDMASTAFVIEGPGLYKVVLVRQNQRTEVGAIRFVQLEAPAMSAERAVAIRSDPFAAKFARITWACRFCSTKLEAYAGLERSPAIELEGAIWYRDIPAQFQCRCKKTVLNIEATRRNLHALLGGKRTPTGEQASFVPLYEQSALVALRRRFLELIDSAPAEEDVQRFIAANPVLLHQFPAERIFPKPSIIGRFYADFAVLTPQKELLFIELEKPSLALMKRDGGVAAPLTHAFDQVRDWLHIVAEHRLAVLEALGLEKTQVSKISGMVIAGRDVGYDAHHLLKLKGTDWGRSGLLTYDDLVYAMDALVRTFSKV